MTVKSGLESAINNKTKCCKACGSMDVKTIESEFTEHLMCLNDNCNMIVHEA